MRIAFRAFSPNRALWNRFVAGKIFNDLFEFLLGLMIAILSTYTALQSRRAE